MRTTHKYAYDEEAKKLIKFVNTYKRKTFCEDYPNYKPYSAEELDYQFYIKPQELKKVALYDDDRSKKVNDLMSEITRITGKKVYLK